MQAIILTDDTTTQLRSFAPETPTAMVSFFDRPVIGHCIRLLARHGVTDIIIAASRHAPEISNYVGDGSVWGVAARYCIASRCRGTAGLLKLAQGMIDGTFIVLNADAVTDADLTSAFDAHASASGIATVMLHDVDEPTEYCIAARDEAGGVTRLLNSPRTSEAFTNTAFTGICVFEPEVLSCIPYDQTYDVQRHLLPRLLNNSEAVYGLDVPGYWRDLRDMRSFQAAHFDVLDGKLRVDIPAVRIDEGIWVGQAVDIDRSVELGAPLYLGEGVSARSGSVLGGYTVLGANVFVDEDARTSRSIVGPGSYVGRHTDITEFTIPPRHVVAVDETEFERADVQRGPVVSQLSYTDSKAQLDLRKA